MSSADWIHKKTYETRRLADEVDLECNGSEVQMVRFHKGKFEHFHKEKTEFFYFIAGEGKAFIGGTSLPLSAGSHLLIKPGVKHSFVNDKSTPLEAIMFKTNSHPDNTFDLES